MSSEEAMLQTIIQVSVSPLCLVDDDHSKQLNDSVDECKLGLKCLLIRFRIIMSMLLIIDV